MAKRNNTTKEKPIISTASLEQSGYTRSYRKIVMFEDLNAAGSIFGGRLVSWIDEGSAIYASCQMNARRIVTKKISELIFQQPARLGDMLEIWCKATLYGTSSLTISVYVTRRSFADDPQELQQKDKITDIDICHCEIVFVSVDEQGKPKAWNHSATRSNTGITKQRRS